MPPQWLSASLARGRGTRPGKGDDSAMRIIKVQGKPYTVINGKDFAVYRWYSPQQHGPVFIQVAGRTSLAKEDLPSDDWIVKGGKDRGNRIATAWRKQWFDYRPDASRKLAFLGGSTEGSYYLALRYLVRRFGLIASELQIAVRASEFMQGVEAPYSFCLDRSCDVALTETALVTLEIPPYFDAATAAQLVLSGGTA